MLASPILDNLIRSAPSRFIGRWQYKMPFAWHLYTQNMARTDVASPPPSASVAAAALASAGIPGSLRRTSRGARTDQPTIVTTSMTAPDGVCARWWPADLSRSMLRNLAVGFPVDQVAPDAV
ncbi:uncharacterized protein B0H18DRAFT_668442 [Fomitopsis serialis]|uniref:uncharacterized protein n=1 Tax=Fomitopsis serialis TaxID=139415 RepID=UPI0020084928|nr:uncharacterized protein B0H18DRAFT_668442 [Neoantrodia serialis]KAH9918450.1 hypothetical protein B0H18DRAFT_668442 [Neoantrodia serialis]